ncbi:hypothetical protein GQ457_15G015950 [Hibiscus cannabinus]
MLVVMCRCAVTRIEKEEMLQHFRKDDEQRDAAALVVEMHLSQLTRVLLSQLSLHVGDLYGSRNATAYWSAEQTKCRKDKAAKYFAAHMALPAGIVPHVKGIFPYSVRAQNPRTPPIKGTLKELVKRGLEEKKKKKR